MSMEKKVICTIGNDPFKEWYNKQEKENTKICNFRGQCAISKRWFVIYHEWLEEMFSTYEPSFYKTISNEY